MKIHPVSIRFRTGLTAEQRQSLCGEMEKTGAGLVQSGVLPYVYYLEGAAGVSGLPGFSEGMFTVQDVNSALAVEAAGIRGGDFVVDVCAAPGGKSVLAAETAARVLARDRTPQKAELIRETADRMGTNNVTVQVYDGRVTDEGLVEKADVVLLDVPCSGLGVIGKKRDIKYRVKSENIKEIVKLQRQIIDASWRYVKPGGILLYSTCTVSVGENEEMVRYISNELPFDPVSLDDVLPEAALSARERLSAERVSLGKTSRAGLTKEQSLACIQLLPGYAEGDGFFIAKFRRRV